MSIFGMFVMFIIYALGTMHWVAAFESNRNDRLGDTLTNVVFAVICHAFLLWSLVRVFDIAQ